jgi:hypothetical protein
MISILQNGKMRVENQTKTQSEKTRVPFNNSISGLVRVSLYFNRKYDAEGCHAAICRSTTGHKVQRAKSAHGTVRKIWHFGIPVTNNET